MGDLILCSSQTAKRPYLIQGSGFPIYSLEELCYYMEENFYMLDKKLLNFGLCIWLKEELGCRELAFLLDRKLRTSEPLYRAALLILEKSEYYDQSELAVLEELFASVDGKAVMECRKLKADQYLMHGKYVQAVHEYRQLLRKENVDRMTDELRGQLYHNQGVAYARLFLFGEAAECFREAYRQNAASESLDCYLFALDYLETSQGHTQTKTELEVDFHTMKDTLDRLRTIQETSQEGEERKRLSGLLDAGTVSFERAKRELSDVWKQEYRKIT